MAALFALTDLATHAGYLALLIGTIFEGESFMIAAGFAAHQGFLSLPLVCAVGALGGAIGDLFWFAIGRRHGAAMIAKRPAWQARLAQVQPLLDRHRIAVIIGCRFAYGLRTLVPVALGASGVRPGLFAFWNSVGAALWAILFGVGGYWFGRALTTLIEEVERFEQPVIIGLVGAGLIAIAVAVWRHRRAIRP